MDKKKRKMGPKNQKKTIKRLMSYITEKYKWHFLFVLICIVVSALAGVKGSMFIQEVIDNHITPLLSAVNPDFSGLVRAILIMALIYMAGVITTLLYNRVMVVIAQGILKTIRDDMFSHMQKLPIKYYDTHSHGDVMSYYTNDTDTLRQMLTMSIPQVFSSLITITFAFFAMVKTSIYLTVLVLVCLVVILNVSKFITGKCGKYFMSQQKALANVNGYVEEMINGQKVVQVFCYEDESKKKFDEINEDLFYNAYSANKFANIIHTSFLFI